MFFLFPCTYGLQYVGEAVYVDDIPSPSNCLHGALICSTKPLARVKGISFKNHPRLAEVPAVITVKDIPKEGENVGSIAMFGTEPLFSADVARYCGDLIGLVVMLTSSSSWILQTPLLVATKLSCS